MSKEHKAEIPVKAFFGALRKGDLEAVLKTFHNDVKITAVRKSDDNNLGLYGSYEGFVGLKSFLSKLTNTFGTHSFIVENILGNNVVAYANGHFVQNVKSSNIKFESDWALFVVVKQGKIYEYHFYEDSASFEKANENSASGQLGDL